MGEILKKSTESLEESSFKAPNDENDAEEDEWDKMVRERSEISKAWTDRFYQTNVENVQKREEAEAKERKEAEAKRKEAEAKRKEAEAQRKAADPEGYREEKKQEDETENDVLLDIAGKIQEISNEA